VRFPCSNKNIFTVLCVFALLAAQAFGGMTGYLCRCGGQEVLTRLSHCHGPHSDACHDVSSHASAGETHTHDESSDSDREDHAPVGKMLEWVQSAGVAAPELHFVLVAIQPEWRFLDFRSTDTLLRSRPWKGSFGPQSGVALRRTVSLMV
jgi:hypothetical protein